MRVLGLAIVQIFSGAVVTLFSWIMADVKARVFNPPSGTYSYMPPDYSVEFFLVFWSLLIVVCGYMQRKMHVKFAGILIFLGLIFTIIFSILGIRAATLGHLEYTTLYYYVYPLIIPGVGVSMIGIIQIAMITSNNRTPTKEEVKLKSLTILQITTGLLATIISWFLGGNKAHIQTIQPTNGSIIVNAYPPSATGELILLGLSIVILIAGIFQNKAHVKGAKFQIILGLMMTGIYMFLGIRAATLGYGERSTIYYLAYLTVALGLVVFVIGVTQIIGMIKNYREGK